MTCMYSSETSNTETDIVNENSFILLFLSIEWNQLPSSSQDQLMTLRELHDWMEFFGSCTFFGNIFLQCGGGEQGMAGGCDAQMLVAFLPLEY